VIRVFHGDDSDAYRRLLAAMLAGDDAIELAGAAGTPEAILEGVAALRPDVVLLDQLGDAGLVAQVRAAAPGVRVVVLSGFSAGAGDPGVAAAADAYCVKSPDVAALRETVLRVAAT
jgi:DNA-binding NarL/FixJ family response regulator